MRSTSFLAKACFIILLVKVYLAALRDITRPAPCDAELSEAVKRLITPKEIRWVGWSHFESDECGALNQWLAMVPTAQAVCGFLGATVSVNDFAVRPPKVLQDGETFTLETNVGHFIGEDLFADLL